MKLSSIINQGYMDDLRTVYKNCKEVKKVADKQPYAIIHLYSASGLSYGTPQKVKFKTFSEAKKYVEDNVFGKENWGEVHDNQTAHIYRNNKWKASKYAALDNDAERIVQKEIAQVEQKLDQIHNKLENLKYNPDIEPETEALHSIIVTLWSVSKDLKHASYESIGKEMIRTGNYILRTLV